MYKVVLGECFKVFPFDSESNETNEIFMHSTANQIKVLGFSI